MKTKTEIKLTKKEKSAMIFFMQEISKGFCMGNRRIVSMQGLERAGLVVRVTINGTLADWVITEKGRQWTP